jgi:hypothetical protein
MEKFRHFFGCAMTPDQYFSKMAYKSDIIHGVLAVLDAPEDIVKKIKDLSK